MRNLFAIFFLLLPVYAAAQSDPLRIATVTRPPFSMVEGNRDVGFAIELWDRVAADLGRETEFIRVQIFGEMLQLVETGRVDGAVANISITAEREERIDFSQPIYESGLQIMMRDDGSSTSIFSAIFTRDIGLAALGALGLLFGSGMLMWVFERRAQPYFDRPLKDAPFPAFWWALNVVVNGGFEERMPQSKPGRLFGVVVVISSLFVVSIFVAQVTAALTVSALQNNITSISDLDGRQVGTIGGSTAWQYLDVRDVRTRQFSDLEDMLLAFEAEEVDAVFFDAPILSYYATTRGQGIARLVERVYRPESYGIALPSGSPLREEVNQSLLRLREDGTYRDLQQKWFGR